MENFYTDIESVQNSLWLKTGWVLNNIDEDSIKKVSHDIKQQKEVAFEVTDMNNTYFHSVRVRATDSDMVVFVPPRDETGNITAEELIACTDELIKTNVARFGKVYSSFIVGNLFKDLKTTVFAYNQKAKGLSMREADKVYINKYIECQDRANELWNLVDYLKTNLNINFHFENDSIQLVEDEQNKTIN